MAVISSLLARLGLDASGFERGVDQAEDQLTKFERRMQKVDAAANVTGAAAGLAFGAGFVKTLSVEAGTGKLRAQLDLTGAQAEKVSQVAGKVFSENFGESTDAVNESLKSVIQGMDGMREASADTLGDITKRAITLADTMGAEVPQVVNAVSQMMRTGLAPDAKTAFDVIQRGAALGADKAGDLLDTFNEYPTQFRDLGLSAQSAMGIMVQGLQGGARDSDLVADALKELNIRVRDMSAAPALKELGLSGREMADAFGKGGPAATKALDSIFDKLRAVKDPTDQYRIAQQLLGTQSEDVSKALASIDPSAATKKLGDFAGANQRAMDSMGNTGASRIESFKRTIMASFVNVIGNYAVPAVQTFMDTLNKLNISPDAIVALGIAITGVAIALKVATLAQAMFASGTIGAAIATKVWAAAQWLLNAAMTANPIGLTIMAIAALVAIVVVAYKKSETFRAIVDMVWRSIVSVAMWAWNTILKPIFVAIGWYINFLIAYYKFLWNVAVTAWNYIAGAFQAAWKIISPIVTMIGNLIKNVLVVYFKIIVFEAKLVWWAIQTYFTLVWKFIQLVFKGIKLYVTSILLPAFKLIGNTIKWVFTTLVMPILRLFWSVAKTTFNGVVSAVKLMWRMIQPIFNALKSALGIIVTTFRNTVTAIGKFWGRLSGVVKKPVSFVVNTVYGKGIKGVWDKVATKVGLPKMPDPPRFRDGGMFRGKGGPRSDSNIIAASNGEFIVNARRTRQYYPLIRAINSGTHSTVLKALGMMGDPGGLPAFRDGGIVGALRGFAGAAKNWFVGGLVKAARAALSPLISATSRAAGPTEYGGLVTGTVRKMVDGILAKFKPLESLLGGGGMGAVRGVRKYIGWPYSWGGGGLGGPSYGIGRGAGTKGFDCSGLTEYGWGQALKGKSIGGTTFSQWPNSRPTGRRPGALGFPHMNHVVMASDKPNKIIQAPYTGGFVEEVADRSNYQWRWPNAAKFDTGYGHLAPGWNMAFNGTGRTETLKRTNGGNSSGGTTIVLENHGVIGSKSELRTWFSEMYEDARRRGRAK